MDVIGIYGWQNEFPEESDATYIIYYRVIFLLCPNRVLLVHFLGLTYGSPPPPPLFLSITMYWICSQ